MPFQSCVTLLLLHAVTVWPIVKNAKTFLKMSPFVLSEKNKLFEGSWWQNCIFGWCVIIKHKVSLFVFFLFGTQVTLSCVIKLSSKDQGWQQIKMTGINSWWLQRYKLVNVTSELSQLAFNHNAVVWFIINLFSWSKVNTQDWIY